MTNSLAWIPSFEHRLEAALPEGWVYAPLGKLGVWGTGNTPSKTNQAFWSGGTLPWVSPKDMKAAYLDDAIDHVTERAVTDGGAVVVPPGTIFFVVRGMILAHTFPVAIVTNRAAFNQDMRSLIPFDGILGAYLLRALQREAPAILSVVREATHGTLRLESEVLQSWPIPIAPVPEQLRIVERIEDLLEQVNRAKVRLDRVSLIMKRFRQSVLASACSGELTKDWREANTLRSRSDVLQELLDARRRSHGIARYHEPSATNGLDGVAIPDSWTWASFEQVTSLITKGSSPRWQGFKYTDSGVLFVRSQNVRWGSMNLADKVFLDQRFNVEHPSSVIQQGDVLLNLVGASVGRPAIATRDADGANCNQAVGILRLVNGPLFPAWVLHYLLSPFAQAHIGTNKADVARANFNLDDIRSMPLPLPPLDEQAESVRRVRQFFQLADVIEQRLHTATTRAEKLPQSILSKAFAGELVPTEAELAGVAGQTYETAIELIDRIRRTTAGTVNVSRAGKRERPAIRERGMRRRSKA